MEFRVLLDRERLNAVTPGPLHLMVEVEAPEVEESKRQPIDVVMVIDVSGSMGEAATATMTKLALTKHAVKTFVDQLLPSDRVGVIVYSTMVRTLVKLSELTATNRQKIIEAVKHLQTESNTDMVGGLLRALSEMSEYPATGDRIRRVMLFTDGMHNVGSEKHADIMRDLNPRLDRITPVTTIGFGAGEAYNPEILTSIAKASSGNFYHAENPDGLIEAFGTELGALRSVAIRDLRVKIRPGNKIGVTQVLSHHPHTISDEGTVIEVGNLYGGEKQFVLLELEVPPVEYIFPRDVLAAEVVAKGIEVNRGDIELRRDAHFRYTKPTDVQTEPNQSVEEQLIRLLAAKATKEAYHKAMTRDYDGAIQAIDLVIVRVEKVQTPEAQMILAGLREAREQVSNQNRFREESSLLFSLAEGYETRRSTGPATRMYGTRAMRETTMGMKAADPNDEKEKKN